MSSATATHSFSYEKIRAEADLGFLERGFECIKVRGVAGAREGSHC